MKAFLYSFRINAVPLVPWIWNQQSVFSLWPNAFKQKMFRLGTQLIYYPNNIHLGSSCQNWIIYMFRTHANGAHITTRNGFKHKIITGSSNPTLWCIWQHNPWKFISCFSNLMHWSLMHLQQHGIITFFFLQFNSTPNCPPDLSHPCPNLSLKI